MRRLTVLLLFLLINLVMVIGDSSNESIEKSGKLEDMEGSGQEEKKSSESEEAKEVTGVLNLIAVEDDQENPRESRETNVTILESSDDDKNEQEKFFERRQEDGSKDQPSSTLQPIVLPPSDSNSTPSSNPSDVNASNSSRPTSDFPVPNPLNMVEMAPNAVNDQMIMAQIHPTHDSDSNSSSNPLAIDPPANPNQKIIMPPLNAQSPNNVIVPTQDSETHQKVVVAPLFGDFNETEGMNMTHTAAHSANYSNSKKVLFSWVVIFLSSILSMC